MTDPWMPGAIIPIDMQSVGDAIRKCSDEIRRLNAMIDKQQVGGTHYVDMQVQPWEAMQAWMTPDEFKGYLRGNVIKYIARAGHKDDCLMDLKKAMHYLEKLVEVSNA